MFGTVRPHPCALSPEDRSAYRQMYCGTCRGLGEYSLAARALVSYDVVLFSAVIDGLQREGAGASSCRCPLNPLIHKPIVPPTHPAMRTAAALQLLLADAWLEDHAQDGPASASRQAARWIRPLLPVERALAELSALGFSAAPLRTITARQQQVEIPGASPEIAVGPTRDLVAHVLASALDLPGVDPMLQTASARRALERMGRALGEVIYLVDALEDLAKDAASGAFNPCLDERGRPEALRVDKAAALLERALEVLGDGVASFPWRRHGALLEQTIRRDLPGRVRAALRQARAVAQPAGEALLPAPPRQDWGRWLTSRLLAFAADDPFVLSGAVHPKRPKKESSWCETCGDCIDCGDCGFEVCESCGNCGCGGCDCGGCDCGGCDCSCG